MNFKCFEKVSDKYFIAVAEAAWAGYTFREIKGTPVKNKLGLDLFVHEWLGGFRVSEGITGARVGEGETTRKAIANAAKRRRSAQLSGRNIESDIIRCTKTFGLSLRYKHVR